MKHWPSGTPSPGCNLAADIRTAKQYMEAGWWGTTTVSSLVAQHANSATLKDSSAFVEDNLRLSWQNYHRLANALGLLLGELGLQHTDRVVAFLPDSALQHIVYLAAERAGLIVVGVGHRAGDAELSHLVGHCGAVALVSLLENVGGEVGQPISAQAALFDRLAAEHPSLRWHLQIRDLVDAQNSLTALEVLTADTHLKLAADDTSSAPVSSWSTQFPNRLGASELFFLNSTSGTTGLPKCVMQTQNRWFYFHQLAAEYGQLTQDDIFAVAVPAPFGFGLWTTHFTPTCLGIPTVVMRRFSPELLMQLIQRERATVLCAVTTQFIMMLNSPKFADYDLSSLRVLFTGGEAIPPPLPDSRQPLPSPQGEGQPACKGPATALGYYNDDAANAQLFTQDGWMLMGDVVRFEDDCLRLVGRTSDFIIRGGKNISAPAVEAQVVTHPAVRLAAAVAAPDEIFGERVAICVELHPQMKLTLEELKAHLLNLGVSKEWLPEYLFEFERLPHSSGGKVAKAKLRQEIARKIQVAAEETGGP